MEAATPRNVPALSRDLDPQRTTDRGPGSGPGHRVIWPHPALSARPRKGKRPGPCGPGRNPVRPRADRGVRLIAGDRQLQERAVDQPVVFAECIGTGIKGRHDVPELLGLVGAMSGWQRTTSSYGGYDGGCL